MLRSTEFYNKLNELKEEYPEVYIEAFTPDDFNLAWDIDYDRCCDLVAILYKDFDENWRKNWDRVDAIVRKSDLNKGE